MDNLVIPMMELAMRSADTSSARNPDSVLLDPDQTDFSRDNNGLQKTASRRFNSKTILSRIDETCGKTTVDASHMPVSKRNFDWELYIHLSCFS